MIRRLATIFFFACLTCSGCNTFYAMRSVPLPPGVSEIKDVTYFRGAAADADKHRLDIYVPAGKRAHPVLVFIFGGAWTRGDRVGAFDVYQKLGHKLAARGILTVVPSYRLAPRHKYPAFMRDAARAVAWVQHNIGRYGGAAGKIYLMGHSAGAQIAALLVCAPRFLKSAGADPAGIAGVVGISGPYDIAFMEKDVPDLTREAFGADPRIWRDASPATHLGRGRLPPFLITRGSRDPQALQHQAQAFTKGLRQAAATVSTFEAAGRNHFTIIIRLAEPGDPLGDAIESFVKKRT